MKTGAPRAARRFLERQRQEGAFGLPQREPPRQCQPQPGLPSLPELDGVRVVDAARGMDQTSRPDRPGPRRGGKPQDTRGAGRPGRGGAAPNAPRAVAFSVSMLSPACR